MRLFIARRDLPIDFIPKDEQDEGVQWSFGQILSALLLVVPIWSMAVGFTTNEDPVQTPPHVQVRLDYLNQDNFNISNLEDGPFLNISSDGVARARDFDFITRDYYQTTSWFMCPLLPGCLNIAFITASQILVLVTKELNVVDFWFALPGTFYFLLTGYPIAYQTTILFGLWMDDWLCNPPKLMKWRRYVYWLVCLVIWFPFTFLGFPIGMSFGPYIDTGIYFCICAFLNLVYIIGNLRRVRVRRS